MSGVQSPGLGVELTAQLLMSLMSVPFQPSPSPEPSKRPCHRPTGRFAAWRAGSWLDRCSPPQLALVVRNHVDLTHAEQPDHAEVEHLRGVAGRLGVDVAGEHSDAPPLMRPSSIRWLVVSRASSTWKDQPNKRTATPRGCASRTTRAHRCQDEAVPQSREAQMRRDRRRAPRAKRGRARFSDRKRVARLEVSAPMRVVPPSNTVRSVVPLPSRRSMRKCTSKDASRPRPCKALFGDVAQRRQTI